GSARPPPRFVSSLHPLTRRTPLASSSQCTSTAATPHPTAQTAHTPRPRQARSSPNASHPALLPQSSSTDAAHPSATNPVSALADFRSGKICAPALRSPLPPAAALPDPSPSILFRPQSKSASRESSSPSPIPSALLARLRSALPGARR